MDALFTPYLADLDTKLQELLAMPPLAPNALPKGCTKGVYLFSQGQSNLYVGRSNNIERRLRHHCNAGSTHGQAAFAFRLARKGTQFESPTYKPGAGSRKGLEADLEFMARFVDAKDQVRKMTVRYVEETNPIKQALLEMYVAVVLNTEHNSFDNH